MKTKILLGLVAILTVFGCKDSFDNFNPDPTNPIDPPMIVEFNASAFVEVVDRNGEPIEGADINLGMTSVSTNEYGVAHLEDVEMGSITYLTVEKAGFFHGSRRFYPAEDRTSHLRVMLLNEIVLGEFESGQGGSLSGDGVSLDFPANGIVDATGSPYNGTVTVSTAAILADDEDIHSKMPGDLVGETLTGEQEVLASYGMVAVELRTPSGAELQVADGNTVEMTVDVPASMQGNAPATIPMWSFDEVEGIWKEETVASLTGGRYVADIPHFTWWNCDAPFPLVKFGATFVFENGGPATQVSVCLTVGQENWSRCGYTNDEGLVCGLIPKNETLLLEVKDPCGQVIYSQEIGPYSDTAMIGPITLPETAIVTTAISGEAIDCDGNPVTDGFVRVWSGNVQYWFDIEDDGTFSGEFINCSSSDVVINVIDEENFKQSLPQTFPFDATIDAGTITACDDIEEIIVLNIPDLDTSYTWLFAYGYGGQGTTQISVQDSNTTGSFFWMSFEGESVGTFDAAGEIVVAYDDGTGSGTVFLAAEEVTVTVTYYGDPGDLIQGSFEGTMQDPSGGTTPFDGTFSALRY